MVGIKSYQCGICGSVIRSDNFPGVCFEDQGGCGRHHHNFKEMKK